LARTLDWLSSAIRIIVSVLRLFRKLFTTIMSTYPAEKSVFLFLTEGSSDKEYHLHLRPVSGGWCAYYANGPRGRVGSSKPVKEGVFSFEVAQAHFDDKLKSKLKSGYTHSETGVRFTNTEEGKQASGHSQQLPTAIDDEQLMSILMNHAYAAQEKANGERRSIEVRAGVVRGINKLGLYVNLPENLVQAFTGFGNAFFDGEQVGTTFYVFDLLQYQGRDLRQIAFGDRYEILANEVLNNMWRPADYPIKLLDAAFTHGDKQKLLQRVRDRNGEGLVFKAVTSPYDSGRSKAALKYKFNESSTCVVIEVNQQRSVGLGLRNAAGTMIPVGNVTIPQNFAVPSAGDLVEVQYLYFNPEGAFEQPVYLGPRNDIQPHEATLSQITRLKPGVGMNDLGRRTAVEHQDAIEPRRERQRQ
jgi:bifunctional non-homologous end joining protein LigD